MSTSTLILCLRLVAEAGATFAQDKTPAPMDHSKMKLVPTWLGSVAKAKCVHKKMATW